MATTTAPFPPSPDIDALKAKFPYALRGADELTVTVGPGWLGPVERLLAIVDQEVQARCPEFRMHRVKEKVGGLRVQYQGGNERIAQAAREAEVECETLCEVCGAPGTILGLRSAGLGCRCEDHR